MTKQRDVYIDRFIKDKSTQYDEDDLRPTDVRAKYWADVTQKSKMFINAFNDPIIKTNFSQPVVSIPPHADIGVKKYQTALQGNPKFASQSTKTASMRSLKKGDVSVTQTDRNALDKKKLADLEGLLAIRRACKFGIEDAVTRRKCRVHYVLDGITIADVVSKKTFDLYSGGQGVPITTSELRFLFRRWNRFRNTTKVIFYRNFTECDPPWTSEELSGWATYAMHLMSKNNVATPIQSTAASYQSTSNWIGIIKLFHDIAS